MNDEILKKIYELLDEVGRITHITGNCDIPEIQKIDLYQPYELAKALRIAIKSMTRVVKYESCFGTIECKVALQEIAAILGVKGNNNDK